MIAAVIIFALIAIAGLFSLSLASMDVAPSQGHYIFPYAIPIGGGGLLLTGIIALVRWLI